MLRVLLGSVAVAAAAWAAVVAATGGWSLAAGGLRLSATDPLRPLLVAAIAAAAWAWVSGLKTLARDLARLKARARAPQAAVLLALAVVALSFGWNTWAVGGSDEYAYVVQADSWLHGPLVLPTPIAAEAPWPEALDTFTPFGYRADPAGRGQVPMTGPGLPILMAGLKFVAGHAAMFVVAPLTGGLLVWTVFVLGRRAAGSDRAALGAAWLVATSPTVLLMSHHVMSDVPVTVCWTLATLALLRGTVPSALAGGLWSAAAVLIRPNMAPLAVLLAAWTLWRDARDAASGRRVARALAFAVAVLPGAAALAAFNAEVYGSPLRSGYGRLDALFSLTNVWPNIQNYAAWLASTQTPLVVLGVLALALPAARSIWPTPHARAAAGLLLTMAVGTCLLYLAYQPFDAWWYLRFLMPAWPAVAVGMAALLVHGPAGAPRWARGLALGAVVGIGVVTAILAVRLGVFPPGEGERRYATVAAMVAPATEPEAAIIAGQHTGAARYYGGRLTVRYDALDPAWLDRAVSWFRANGRPVYVLLEDWERQRFVRRFGSAGPLGRLELSPVLAGSAAGIPGTVFLYDPQRPDGPTAHPPVVRDPKPLCPLPAPPVALTARPPR